MWVDFDEFEGESCVWVFFVDEMQVVVEVLVLKSARLAH